MGKRDQWSSRKGAQRQFQKHHLEGHDEDDARDGGNSDEPTPPNGGDEHRGQADDEQGASKPENLGRKT